MKNVIKYHTMDISERIRTIRESKKNSQTQVANAMGTERSNYHRLENRGEKLTLEQLSEIANALGVSVREILGFGVETTDKSEIEILENENNILREENKKWIAKIEDLEDDKRRLKNELEEYESLIFDNNLNFTTDNFIKAIFIISSFPYFRMII